MPLIKDSETTHIMMTGATGTGKTTLFHKLLPQIRDKDHPAIVIDQTGEFVLKYWRPNDIVFNPLDANTSDGAFSWDFLREVSNQHILDSVATTLFCDNRSVDPMWGLASKRLFIDVVELLIQSGIKEPSEVYDFFIKNNTTKMSKELKDKISSKYLDSKNDKTGMSILTNTISFIHWVKLLKNTNNMFTIKDFVHNPGNRWMFITSTPSTRTILQGLQSVLLDIAVVHLMDMKPSNERRFWFIIDELPALKQLAILPKALSELRKYGGCVLTGIQNISQLDSIYGETQAKTIFAQFGTKALFRVGEYTTAKSISLMFGDTEHEIHNESIQYGAHQMRDGVSMGTYLKTKQLLSINDINSLENLELFLSMPNEHVQVTKIKLRL